MILKKYFSVSFFLIVFSLTACTAKPKKMSPKPADEFRALQFAKAKTLIRNKKFSEGKEILSQLVSTGKTDDITDDSLYLLGNYYLSKKDYQKAYRHFLPIIKSEYYSPIEAKAYLKSSICLQKNGQKDEALGLINKSLTEAEFDSATLLKTHELRGELSEFIGDHTSAFQSYSFAEKNHPEIKYQRKYHEKNLSLISSSLSIEALKEILKTNTGTPETIAMANFKVGEHFYNENQVKEAKPLLSKVIEISPGSEVSERAAKILSYIDATQITDSASIGVVLPLSGRHKQIGQKALKGVQLALGIFGDKPSPFKLTIIDSEGNPATATKGVEKLIREEHVIAIIGGLISKTSVVVSELSNKYQIPNISLSQKSKITDIGKFVYRNAITSEYIVRALVKTAMERKGFKNFAIMYPNDKYGVEYSNLFWNEVKARGGNITGSVSYDPKETDFRKHVKKLVGIDYKDGRKSEYRFYLNRWLKKNKGKRISQSDDILPPIIEFDALFVPDGTRAIGQIAPMLKYYDVNKVTLLGTNIWNQPSLIRRGQEYVEGALFVDDSTTSLSTFKNSNFYNLFKKTFEEEPNTFSAQAYDSAKLISIIVKSGFDSREKLLNKLSSLNSFIGTKGKIFINNKREMISPLTSLVVNDKEVKTLNQLENDKKIIQ